MFLLYAGVPHSCFTGKGFFPESTIYSLLKTLRTGRHMWKELSVPGRQGTKPLLLNLDSLPSLGSLTHPLVLENSATLSQSQLKEKHTSSGADWTQGAVKYIDTLSSLTSSCPFSPRGTLQILVCP